jgi:hypothetical protein
VRRLLVLVACAVFSVWATVAQAVCVTDLDCSDGDVCTGAERCQGGVCLPGTPLQCGDLSPCTVDSCDRVFGCQHAPVVNGTPCSDGNACDGAETCQGGVCQPGTPLGDGASCSTGNPCTNSDVCRGGVCVVGIVRPDGSGCSDGNPCNGAETCHAGVCTAGTPAPNGTTCGDAEPCNGIDTCQAGACVTGPVPAEGSPCSDGFVCNGLEVCHGGVCTPGPRAPDGTSCSDGNQCNGAETCSGGICRGGTAPNCDDHNECTVDSCDKQAGCTHVPRVNGTLCGDHDPCNGQETCQGGVCSAGSGPPPTGTPCDDGDVCNGHETCQNQKCSPGTPLPDGSFCADSNLCNGLETCSGAHCVAGNPLVCTDNNPCTTDSCDPSTGCKYTTKPDGSSCDDGNVCNGVGTCTGGTCSPGTAPNCGTLACDPSAGCVSDHLIAGRKILLRAGAHAGSGTDLKVQTRGQISTSTPPAQGTDADPVLHGGVLRLRSVAGGFDLRFDLPKQNWVYLRAPEDNRGFEYRDRAREAAVNAVIVKDGRLTKILGGNLQVPLANDPDPVDVTLIIGSQRYCMSFGGDAHFDANRRFLAEDAPAPGACPP